ncbi:translation initiation factor SUI1 [Melampsora americana]|nr:translation initiation factor SUI1 [Melampsora americana]
MAEASNPSPQSLEPVIVNEVLYCKICTFPIEYCEFGTSLSKCKVWLSESNPNQFELHYPNQIELENKLSNLSLEEKEKVLKDLEKLNKEAVKKELKEETRLKRLKEKSLASKVTIKTIERTKRKRITTVHGLEAFGVDLKKLSKLFASKFATGSSVTKNNQGEDEIVIQGDVSDEVLDLFEETNGKFADLIGNGKIPDENIVFVDDTKKKKT